MTAGADAPGALVEVRDAHKAYDDGRTRHEVLAGVDLDVRAGEIVALLGPSGSGKSTLLNVIAGIDTLDRGSVRVGGRPITTMGERERTLLRRRDIGFVFQFFNLVPTLSVLENVLFPLELNGIRDTRAATALLERVGLGDRGRAFPDELSGGEQQRVALARAVVHRPALLLADEPTGNLDTSTGTGVLDLLAELAQESGTALLVATHSAEVVARAHRVVAMKDGLVVARPEAGRAP